MAVSVTVTSGEGLAVTIQAGPHCLAADEPAGSGGTDTGPDPSSLLLAALGACTAMTLLLSARRCPVHQTLEGRPVVVDREGS